MLSIKIIFNVLYVKLPQISKCAFFFNMMSVLYLSSFGFQNVARLNFEKDFIFKVGGNEYLCSKMLASFISPKITNNLLADNSNYEFVINDSDDNNEFEKIISLLNGEAISIEEEQTKSYLIQIAIQLGNNELVKNIVFQTSELNHENVISRMIYLSLNGCDVDDEVQYIATNFDDFPIESLKLLGVDNLERILSSQYLRTFNEDSLFKKIQALDGEFLSLLGYIQTEYLSEKNIMSFINLLDYNNMTAQIWMSLTRRFQYPRPSPNDYRHYCECLFDSGYPFDGVFSSLTAKYDGNPHKENIVKISASSDPKNNVYEIINYEWEYYYYSENQTNSWIMFDFQKLLLSLTDYTLQSDGSGENHLEEWVIEGSMDSQTWSIIDARKTKELNASYGIKSFHCEKSPPYRYIRLRQTGFNSSFQYYLLLGNIELFGQLSMNETLE